MDENKEKRIQDEYITSPIEDLDVDAAGLDGRPLPVARDKSLNRNVIDYDETSGPGGASGITDDPALQGSTGIADDVGMHVEPGYSVGYDTGMDYGFDGDTGNAITGGVYNTLADAAQDLPVTPDPDQGTGLETALGVPDVNTNTDRNLSIENVSDDDGGYGAAGTDTDVTDDQAT
ncbi:MAG TPA: hypothetical protein VH186_10360 [Chloroflexia bacterium]|nr:hypothetical protein [Chloroflexia bacterium]